MKKITLSLLATILMFLGLNSYASKLETKIQDGTCSADDTDSDSTNASEGGH